jgi:predicted nucleic-acid-binding protein
MVAVDTNVLIRLIIQDDPKQLAAAKRAVAKGAWVATLVLAEVIWVLESHYECKKAALVSIIELLLAHELLHFEDMGLARKAFIRFAGASKISFSDCLVIEAAIKAGNTPLLTFDAALSKQNAARKP